jgi:hypothetical protein
MDSLTKVLEEGGMWLLRGVQIKLWLLLDYSLDVRICYNAYKRKAMCNTCRRIVYRLRLDTKGNRATATKSITPPTIH